MYPLFRKKRYLLLSLFVWIMLATALTELVAGIVLFKREDILIWLIPPLFLLFFLNSSSWYLCRKMSLSAGNFWKVAVAHLTAAIFTQTIWWGIFFLYTILLDQFRNQLQLKTGLSQIFLLLFLFGFASYLSMVFLHYLLIENENKRMIENRLIRARIDSLQAELLILRNTIHPHFLFNAFNALNALIAENASLARQVLTDLAEFLRYSLAYQKELFVPLEKEIGHISNYLRVEKIRLGRRLSYRLNVARDCSDFPVLALSLFPLAENSVKHGIQSNVEGGEITVDCMRQGRGLLVRISNPLPPADYKCFRTEQLGLATLRRRLELVYQKRAQLNVFKEETGFIAEIFFPEQEKGAD